MFNGKLKKDIELLKNDITNIKNRLNPIDGSYDDTEQKMEELKLLKQELAEKESELKTKEIEAEKGFQQEKADMINQAEKEIRENNQKIENELKAKYSDMKDDLNNQYSNMEKKLREQYSEKENELNNYYENRSRKINDAIDKLRKEKQEELEQELAQKKEDLEYTNQLLKNEKEQLKNEIDNMKEDIRNEKKRLEEEKQKIEQKQNSQDNKEIELKTKENELDLKEKFLNNKENNIDEEIDNRMEDEREQFETAKNNLNKILENTYNEKLSLNKELDTMKFNEKRFGKYTISQISNIINEKDYKINELDEIKRKYEDKYSHISDEDLSNYKYWGLWKEERESLTNENNQQKKELQEYSYMEEQLTETLQIKQYYIDENNSLKKQLEDKKAEIKALEEGHTADYDKCKDSIEKPYITFKDDISETQKKELYERNDEASSINEIDWLDRIIKGCENSNIIYPKRLIYPFHNSLKSSDWTSLTVLAGTSGTGKSLLPYVYSYYGGLVFNNTPIQPNWTDQRDLLGYYDLTTNDFNATTLMRLLAQSQRNDDDKEGFNDALLLVLLDEMNLARPEQYFSDFLSLLESKRNKNEGEDIKLEVNIGTSDKYKLTLGDNILFCGTMNEDESAHTLSDKVIDRSNLLVFPTPKELISRKNNKLEGDKEKLLHKAIWNEWKKVNSFEKKWDKKINDEENEEQKKKHEEMKDRFVDKMKEVKNKMLEIQNGMKEVNRAVGNRIWQSTENYISIYPEVIAADETDDLDKAFDKAFEDQLAMKVMPKLRGIQDKNKLKGIKNLLDHLKISEDFESAMNNEYGFHFNSAEYLFNGENNND